MMILINPKTVHVNQIQISHFNLIYKILMQHFIWSEYYITVYSLRMFGHPYTIWNLTLRDSVLFSLFFNLQFFYDIL